MTTADVRWLVYDRREAMADKPGIHALVIGVSAYRYLSSGPEAGSSQRTLGLGQLSVAARSAYVLHNWLRNNADRLATPLKTLRLLVAPSPSEADEIEGTDQTPTDGGFADLVSAAYAWRDDASQSPDDTALFYFCGHGFDLRGSEPVIALGDFGAPNRPVLAGTIALANLIQGLAPSDLLPRVARTQLYFIDAGRPPVSFDYTSMTVPPVFDLPRAWLDDRQLVVCHAASPGQNAWAVLGGTTFFLVALMRCLQGAAAIPDHDSGRPGSTPGWQVTVNSLVRALPTAIHKLASNAGLPEQQQIYVNASMSREVILFRLDSPPLVEVTVEFQPAELSEQASIDIRQADGALVAVSEIARAPGRRQLILAAGLYATRISFPPVEGTTRPAAKDLSFITSVQPPDAVWSVGPET